MIQILVAVALLAEPRSRSWLGVSLVEDGACLRVAAMATNGPFASGGGKLNQCIARIRGHRVSTPKDARAIISAQLDGQIADIELSTGERVRVRLEREPADSLAQICLGTAETQVVVIVSTGTRERAVVYRTPVTLGSVILNEHLSGPVSVLIRTCANPIARLVDQPSLDLQLTFGSAVVVEKRPAGVPPAASAPTTKRVGSDDDSL